MNFLKDLFNQEELDSYIVTPFPFNLHLMKSKVEEKVKANPDYEVFVPLVYYKCEELRKDNSLPAVIKPYKYYVSNRGRIISLRGKEPLVITTALNARGYVRFNVSIKGSKQIKLLLHRAVACSFTPVLKELGPVHPKNLQVNHLNGIKENCESTNLEWCTGLENVAHATSTGLVPSAENHYANKPVKGRVLGGPFKGHEFILIGSKEMKDRGFFKEAVSRCCLGVVESHLNCSFSFASQQDILNLPRSISDEIFNSITALGKGVKPDILATNLSTGEVVVIRGGKPKLLALGFDESSVSKVINGKLRTHKGYTFKRATPA